MTALGVGYEVYTDYQNYGGFTEDFKAAAMMDIGKNAIVIGTGVTATALGAPVIIVAGASGALYYIIDTNYVQPAKENLGKNN